MKLWKRIADFFERGDLVPFAVLISAWHFVIVLIKFDEFAPVAIAQGIFVDMLHFRTVRRAVASSDKKTYWVAVLTTLMSYSFHLLFYVVRVGDNGLTYHWSPVAFLLAAPLPLGIPILAWQQSLQSDDKAVSSLHNRLTTVIKRAACYRQQLARAQHELAHARQSIGEAQQRYVRDHEANSKLAQERDKLADELGNLELVLANKNQQLETMARQAIMVDRLPPRLAKYCQIVAQGNIPNGQFSDELGVGVSTLARANSLFELKE